MFEQYLFELQWAALKRYANERGVYLFGDLPFYVDRNSVDVWWDRRLFALDASGEPLAVAGVPPDYFNADGQLWGNPLYDWDAMERERFPLVARRASARSSRASICCASIISARSSRIGRCRPERRRRGSGSGGAGRGDALLDGAARASSARSRSSRRISGIITDEVRALRDRFELPGMVVLQFAFDGSPDNPHLPQHHRRNSVVYTGTHDNDTTVGWYASLDARARDVVHGMLGVGPTPPVPEFLIDAAYASNAALAIVPMQDLLGARLGRPHEHAGHGRRQLALAVRVARRAGVARRVPAASGPTRLGPRRV